MLPRDPGSTRAVVLAESGFGKTELFKALAACAIRLGWKVVMVDAKGDERDVDRYRAAVEAVGGTLARVDGVRVMGGGSREVLDVLGQPFADTGTDASYYHRRTRRALNAALKGGPETVDDLLGILRDPAGEGAPQEVLEVLNAKAENEQTVGAVAAAAIEDVWGPLGDRLCGTDDLLDFGGLDADFTLLPLRPLNQAEQLLGVACLTAYRSHLVRIQRGDEEGKPLLVLVDEFPQLVADGLDAADQATALIETARSAGQGLIVAAQSVEGLSGDPVAERRLLGGGAAVILGRMKAPEQAVSLGGTDTRLEAAANVEVATMTSGRTQHVFAVDPNRVRQAQPGHWWILQGGGVALRSTTNITLSISSSLLASCAALKLVRVLPEPVVCQTYPPAAVLPSCL